MKADCIFCTIVSGSIPGHIIAANELCVGFLDAAPVNPGHTLVVPRRHLSDIHELDEATSAAMFNLARQIAGMLNESPLHCEGINLLMSNGAVAEQSVFHAHLHVVPRIAGDGFGFVEAPTVRPDTGELAATARLLRLEP